MLKKKIAGLVAGIGAAAVVSGAAMAQNGVSDTEITLGAHTSLSGGVAVWGVPSTTAARIVFDKANAEGGIHGRKIKYIVEDHQYQVPRAVQAGNKLINRDKIFAMVAALGTPMNNAVLRSQLARKVPNLHPFTAARSMSEPHHPLKFTALGNYYDQTRAVVNYFAQQKGKKKICVAYQDSDFGQEMLDGTVDELKALGLEVAAKVPHKPTETEFVASVTALKNAGCEVVVMGTIVTDTIKLYATARGLGYGADFVGTTAAYDDLIAVMAKGATEGFYAAASYTAIYEDQATGEAKEFFDAYKAVTGKVPTGAAQLGYISAKLVVEALKLAGPDLTTDSFVKAHENIKDFQDPFGGEAITYTADNHKGRTGVLLHQISGGKWKVIENRIN